eukprot:m51a1_g12784 hypothetical protein (168) ;mRNA; r:2579-3482
MYYIADLVEEYSQIAKKCVRYLIFTLIAVHVLLILFESELPWFELLFGLAAHLLYCTLLPNYPYVNVTSVRAIASAVMAVCSHFLWFRFMLDHSYYTYGEVVGLFVTCVWLGPLVFLVSLSTMEPLPYGASPSLSEGRKGRNLVATLFRFLHAKQEEILPHSAPKTL